MKKILSIIGVALLAASCTKDYTDWAKPFSNEQEAAKSVSLNVSPGAAIDFKTVTAETVQLFSAAATAEDEYTVGDYTVKLFNADNSKSQDIAVDNSAMAATADLKNIVYSFYGRRPVARQIPMEVTAVIKIGNQAFKQTVNTTLTATPDAPEIEDAYYITGTVNGWDNTNTAYELSNGGKDPYDNPEFMVMIPASAVTGDIEFKVTPKSGLGGDWSKCLTASDVEGSFATNNAGGNLKVAQVEGAKFYRIVFNMLEQTWSGAGLAFGDFFYEIGNESGWATSHALAGPANDGKYQGFYYLDGEYKFKPNADNWDNDLEYVSGDTMSGKLTDAGGPNCPDPGAGFYQINLDAGANTFALTKIEAVGIIGDFNGWGGDVDMTYNKDAGCWEATTEIASDGGLKFRANHDWAINWGGDSTKSLTQDGANLNVKAGTYKFQLFLSYNGAHYVTITAQ